MATENAIWPREIEGAGRCYGRAERLRTLEAATKWGAEPGANDFGRMVRHAASAIDAFALFLGKIDRGFFDVDDPEGGFTAAEVHRAFRFHAEKAEFFSRRNREFLDADTAEHAIPVLP